MAALRLVLLAEGPGDRALIPILIWALRAVAPSASFFDPEFEARGGKDIPSEIERVSRNLRPDILFVHRDADNASLERRQEEIPVRVGSVVRVVPVRMTEAWLLIDATAIRKAAGNPNGRIALELPKLSRLEALADPKGTLRRLLLEASEHTGQRRRKQFARDIGRCVHLVSEYTSDFEPLRKLQAFRAFEEDLRMTFAARGRTD